MKLQECYVFSCICPSFWPLGGFPCDHYLWCIEHDHTGRPPPTQLGRNPSVEDPPSGHFQTCSLWSTFGWQASGWHPTGTLSCWSEWWYMCGLAKLIFIWACWRSVCSSRWASWGKFWSYTLYLRHIWVFSDETKHPSRSFALDGNIDFAVWHVSVPVNHCCVFLRARKVWLGFVSSVAHGNIMEYWFVLNKKHKSLLLHTNSIHEYVFGWNWGIELLPPANGVRKVTFSVISVCLSEWRRESPWYHYPWCIGPHCTGKFPSPPYL